MADIPFVIRQAIPLRLRDEILSVSGTLERVEEIRIHARRRVSLTSLGRNNPTGAVFTRNEMDEMLNRLCEGSVYAYRDTIAEGYITLRDGIRVGICGRAVTRSGKVSGVYDIDSLIIRIPHPSPPLGREIVELIESMHYTKGVLLYAPPGVGKTTLLRSLAILLSTGERARRVSVVDTRGELAYSLDNPSLCLDLLSGYPKEIGISLASRTLGSEVIICDEISTYSEAEAIRSAHNCGVPLIATTHAASVGEMLGKSGIGILHKSGCFGAYVGIKRQGNFGFVYDVCKREDADIAFLNGNL